MPQLYHFVADQYKENLVLGGQPQHMVAGRLCQYLKPWQLEGLRFLYKNYDKSEACILNDESGLGKVVTVTTFLGSILTNDTTKKCLIVVRDDAAIEQWRFHLSVLTHLTVKVIQNTSDIKFETVFLIKWCTLKDICDINKVTFDHVILDNRGQMLNNKFCTGLLLRYFENKTTIIICSADVTSDIKLLHILLRLCGRLDQQYRDVKVFEDKFQLPQLQEGVTKKVDLEDYFVKREKVINFCREFRLRRYCHQFDEQFPIVSRSQFQRHLEHWQNQTKNSLTSSSGSVKLLSSSSEKDTEELFKEFFQVKKERNICKLDYEVQQINEECSVMDYEDDANSSDDVVVMSPLLLVSESESDNDQTQIQNEHNSEFIEEVESEKNTMLNDNKKTSKDFRITSESNRRKSKKPIKTPPESNRNSRLNDNKKLRSRAVTSPKKPLPISTKSKKSSETDKLKVNGTTKQNTDKETNKHRKSQEIVKKTELKAEEKTKIMKEVCKEIQNNGKPDKEDKNKHKKKLPEGENLSKENKNKKNILKDKQPEESSKQKDNETKNIKILEHSEVIQETQRPKSAVRVKLRSFRQKVNDKREKIMPTLKDSEKIMEESKKPQKIELIQQPENVTQLVNSYKNIIPSKEKCAHIVVVDEVKKMQNEKPKILLERKKLVLSKNSNSNYVNMLVEAKKFITNENIGKRTRKSANTKTRAKTLEVPDIVIVPPTETAENPNKKSTSIVKISELSQVLKKEKERQKPTKTLNTAGKSKSPISKHRLAKLTELTPIGVHSASTRGMKRQTRSNPSTSKYMKVSVAQVNIARKKISKQLSRRRRSSFVVKKEHPNQKRKNPPSPTPSAISASPEESLQLGQALSPTNNFVVPDVDAPAPSNFNYHFPLMLDKETSDSECLISSQASNPEVIVLTGSSTNEHEMEPPKNIVSRRKITCKPPMVTIHRPIFSKAKSPDLFSTCSDLSLPCSQQHTNKSQFEGFKIFGSELRQPVQQPVQQRSCLDILERMLEPRSGIVAGKKSNHMTQEKPKTSSHQHCMEDEDAMFEITANGTFGNTVRVNSNGEMSPIPNKNQNQSTPPSSGHPKNRITNYLISNSQHTSVLVQPSLSSVEDVTDLLPKTPMRRKSLSGIVKRSPRPLTAVKSQSTKLTQWLLKNSNAQVKEPQGKSQSTKRRRLELSFPTDK